MPAATAGSDADQYITQQETAAILNVTVRTVRSLIDRGELPAYRLGGRVIRICREDVDKVLTRMSGNPVEEHIAKVLAAAPPLSDEQRTRLAELLRPVWGAVVADEPT